MPTPDRRLLTDTIRRQSVALRKPCRIEMALSEASVLPETSFLLGASAVSATPVPRRDEAPPSEAEGVRTPTPVGGRYRADIDGLRALAVIAVILRHAGGPKGGFLGVDIFFVISGYLIYRDLLSRLGQGRLSILAFYARRMRRTIPALYVVLAATFAVATMVLMPGDLVAMARSLIAAVLLVSNITFMPTIGYFDAEAITKPLIHTWSLGVEAQFYLIAPLLPLALRGTSPVSRRRWLLALLAATVVIATAWQAHDHIAAFYLTPARVFEFLVGMLLVEGLAPAIRTQRAAEAVTMGALAAIAVAMALSGRWPIPHPGLYTLLPCGAAAAIIHVGTTWRTRVGDMLAWRPVAFIGLISYSLYLWHWPILVFAHYADIPATVGARLVELLLLIALSVLSWRFVETPFRRRGSVWRARGSWLVPGAAGALVAAAALVVTLHGLPGRFPAAIDQVASYYSYIERKPFRQGSCFLTSSERASDFDRVTCLGIASGKANVLILGDSHAAQLWSGLHDTWPQVNFLQATASGCKPFRDATGSALCTDLMRDMMERFIPDHRLDAIVIGGLWEQDDIAPLERTVAALRGLVGRVVVVGPVPRYDTPAASLIANAMLRGDLGSVARHLAPRVKRIDAAMRAAVGPIATYVSPYAVLCPGDVCRLFAAPNVPLQFDYHHLTPAGADTFMAAVRERDPSLFAPGGRAAYRSTSSR